MGSWTDDTIEAVDAGGQTSVFASVVGSPAGMAFDSKGNLYVASWNTASILKFDANGNRSVFVSGLLRPRALATDSQDNVYVAAGSEYRSIERFDPSGAQTHFAPIISDVAGSGELQGGSVGKVNGLKAYNGRAGFTGN